MSQASTKPAKLGKSLPPGLIVRFGKFVWTTIWHLMMSNLAPRNAAGEFVRSPSQFRHTICNSAEHPYPPASGRYRLIVGLGCPWAHRTLVTHALKGLDQAIPVAIVSPSPNQGIWVFDQEEAGCRTLPEFYQMAQPGYSGRSTVPVLWDTQTKTIVNNESAEIIVLLNSEFNAFATHSEFDLYPVDLRERIDQWNEKIYPAVNNGVYRCGFAQTQAAYDKACDQLFTMLNEIDTALATQRYLCGDRITLADVRLFTTLFRFDLVYHGLFKCNRCRIQDYPYLGLYLRDLYQLPSVAATCNLEAVKRDYYGNLFPLNPGGIIPAGPVITNLLEPHGRDRLTQPIV